MRPDTRCVGHNAILRRAQDGRQAQDGPSDPSTSSVQASLRQAMPVLSLKNLSESNMKVTAVTTLSAARFNYVKVETDEGLTGVGELHPASGTGGTPFVPRAAVEYCAEYLVGKDPLHIERHWQHMFRRQLFRGCPDMMAAIGAFDIALRDNKGKPLGKPVHELLGGPVRDKVSHYSNLGGNPPAAWA